MYLCILEMIFTINKYGMCYNVLNFFMIILIKKLYLIMSSLLAVILIGYQKGWKPERPCTKKAKLTKGSIHGLYDAYQLYVFMPLMYMSNINTLYLNVGNILYFQVDHDKSSQVNWFIL